MKRNLFAAMAILMALSFGACSKSGDKSTASTTPGEKSAKSNKEGDAKSAKSNKEGDKGADAAAAGTPDSAPKAH